MAGLTRPYLCSDALWPEDSASLVTCVMNSPEVFANIEIAQKSIKTSTSKACRLCKIHLKRWHKTTFKLSNDLLSGVVGHCTASLLVIPFQPPNSASFTNFTHYVSIIVCFEGTYLCPCP